MPDLHEAYEAAKRREEEERLGEHKPLWWLAARAKTSLHFELPQPKEEFVFPDIPFEAEHL